MAEFTHLDDITAQMLGNGDFFSSLFLTQPAAHDGE